MAKKWRHKVSGVRTLLNEFEPGESSSAENMKAVHAIISRRSCFEEFMWLSYFEEFEDTDDFESDMEEANALLEVMYDYADTYRIWIE